MNVTPEQPESNDGLGRPWGFFSRCFAAGSVPPRALRGYAFCVSRLPRVAFSGSRIPFRP